MRAFLLVEDEHLVEGLGIPHPTSWASGSGKVPSYSMGFWVAMTMNGCGSGRVVPSTDM
jgi:hypothetical protein